MKKGTYAGINPRARIEIFPDNVQKIIRKLAGVFYVTGGCNKIMIGRSEYLYCFIKFPDDMSELFGAKNEMIALFSSFSNFEPRTLDAI